MGLIQGVYGAGRRLWNVLGTSRHAMTICTIAGGFGTGYTLGDNRVGMDPETLRFSKRVVLWGANVLSTNPHLWRSILEARKNGAQVVAIDPIRTGPPRRATGTSRRCPGRCRARPQPCSRSMTEQKTGSSEHTAGWEFRQRILEFPRAPTRSQGPAESSSSWARLAENPRAFIGIGIQRHGGGGMTVRTITYIQRHGRLAPSGRRRLLRHAQLLRRELGRAQRMTSGPAGRAR
jgi:hypothetical protein